MKPSVRSKSILTALQQHEELTVEKACELFNISPATVRRDFVNLAKLGKVEKTWGGIRLLTTTFNQMAPYGLRQTQHIEEKRRIAAHAATLCSDSDIIFVDGGTTTQHLAPFLANRPMRIVTNSILIAHEIDRLRSGPVGPEVFLTGGYLYPNSGFLLGPEAIASLKKYHADVCFLSVGGLDPEHITNNHHLFVEVERFMLQYSKRHILLADHSKFGRHELVSECSWSEVDLLITDQYPANEYTTLLDQQKIVVV